MTPEQIVDAIIEDMDHREFLGQAWRALSSAEQDAIATLWCRIIDDGIDEWMNDWEC